MKPTVHYNGLVEHEQAARKPEQQPVCGRQPRTKRDQVLVTSTLRFVTCWRCCEAIY